MENEGELIQQLKDNVAAQIRAARAFGNKTQEEVANVAGVSRQRLSLIEQGKANPQIATLGKIMAALGFRIHYGFTDKG